MAYAETTSVSIERSQMEIQQIVRRYDADGFTTGWEGNRAMVQFRFGDRYVRFLLILPKPDEERFTTYKRGGRTSSRGLRTPEAARSYWEQACRQKWRALALVIKAKLEAVDAGIVTFDQEFMPHLLMPDGQTIYESTRERIAEIYASGTMQPLLPAPPS